MAESTFIGLDVHARSVVAGVLDGESGEVRTASAPVGTAELVTWLHAQGASVAVTYEAGPTGYGLARACEEARIPCLVAAPSKIATAPGERVKTDRRDALRLAKLLRLGELTAVRVPTRAEEAARDLVRAREDARADLMRARHRLSKLLLRHGLVWEAGTWTQAHERWLAAQRFAERGLQLAYEESLEAVASVRRRRDALDAAIAEEAASEPWADVVGRLACLRGVSTLTAFGLACEIGDSGALRRALDRRLPGAGAQRELLRRASAPGGDHQDRQRSRPAPPGRGRLAPAQAPLPGQRAGASPAGPGRRGARTRRCRRTPSAPPLAELRRARQALHGGRCGRRSRARRLVLEPRRHGRLKAYLGRRGERAGRARGACAAQL